ncbi:hypothetical protein [Novosphingobium sp. KA1]|uniref:hypothetical protein n=1 Tax=Novosphingobium sp. (strain KA1) TaxID=164608 RepID=UPI001A8EDD2B|nr:hypothetical protein [Novosphingobium sp. KA1]QSR18322.1 hypothetical protein CA833_14170 [Novosphingobium sp. KA1]
MQWKVWVAIVAASFWPGAAQAAWFEASSEHFVIYADDSEKDITQFAEQLERYHSGMARALGSQLPVPSPSNRVTIYVVNSEREVRTIYGEGSRYVGGFYVPRAGGSLAIIPPVHSSTGDATITMIPLLHEYAHHFLISTSSTAMPRWLSEGAAEFFATSRFDKDGSLWLGRAAQHRAGELFFAADVTASDLLDPEQYERRKHGGYDAFYGRSWLLYHYLSFDPARRGQLSRYLDLLRAGAGQREAAEEAFGGLQKLDRDMDLYLKKGRMTALQFPADSLHVGTITVRALGAGEAAILPVQIRSKRGVGTEDAPALLTDAKAIAARFPGDPAVLSALAEAAYDAGDDKAAIAAADAAIALDPRQVNAYVQKGYALFRIAQGVQGAQDRPAAFKAARVPFVALNHLENDHPLPLVYYYRSFLEQGMKPPALAVQGLIRAVELAPFDQGLRMDLGYAFLRLGRSEEARDALTLVANDPHGGALSEKARGLIAHIEADPKWDGHEDASAAAASSGG